ncbi:MAG TPA: CoA pyrophosphatase [Polyangiaceae bacterium]
MSITLASVRAALEGRAYRPATLQGDERFAAVAAVLRERNGEAEVLLIRRADHPSDPWSGHMALPGGRCDPTDPDLVETAVRETYEEVGLTLSRDLHLVGRLDDLPAFARGQRAGLVVAVFVFGVTSDPSLVPNAAEVEETLWANVSALASGEHDTTYPYRYENRDLALPAYDVEGRIVWGLTHRMLGTLFEVLDGRGRARYETSS